MITVVAASAGAQDLTLGRALQAALVANPDVRILGVRVEGAAAVLTQAQGIYDPLLTATAQRYDENRPLTTAESLASPLSANQYARSSGFALGVEQKTTSGASLIGVASGTYGQDRIAQSLGLPSQTTGRLAFGVRLPLARGSGEQAVGAGIRAAERDLEATNAQRRYVISLALRDTAAAFWEYAARWRQLEIARAGERRAAGLVDELRKLLAADEIPAAEIDLSSASLVERVNARIAAEQALSEARLALGRVMGVEPGRLGAIAAPANALPQAVSPGLERIRVSELVDGAGKLRDDLHALTLLIAAAREKIEQARDSARPLVDLTVSVGVSGLREGTSLSAYPNPLALSTAGPSVLMQLGAQYPYGNRYAQGQIGQAMAALTDLEIRANALRTEIAAGVTTSAEGLQRAAQLLAVSRDLVGHYTKALEAERTKRRLGMSTLIDVIAVEDRLQSTALADIDRRRNYAVSIVRLKHELGTLLRPGGDRFDVREDDFLDYRPDAK